MAMVRDIISYKNRKLVEDFLKFKGSQTIGPFTAKRIAGVYGAGYIEIYADKFRIVYEDVVYSKDPDVHEAMKEVAETLESMAERDSADEVRAKQAAREQLAKERDSTFSKALKIWNRSK